MAAVRGWTVSSSCLSYQIQSFEEQTPGYPMMCLANDEEPSLAMERKTGDAALSLRLESWRGYGEQHQIENEILFKVL